MLLSNEEVLVARDGITRKYAEGIERIFVSGRFTTHLSGDLGRFSYHRDPLSFADGSAIHGTVFNLKLFALDTGLSYMVWKVPRGLAFKGNNAFSKEFMENILEEAGPDSLRFKELEFILDILYQDWLKGDFPTDEIHNLPG